MGAHSFLSPLFSVFPVFIVLDQNNFSGQLDGQKLLSFPELGELAVGVNKLKGSVPGELGSLTQLGSLILDTNELTGTIPAELANGAPLREYLHSLN